MTSDRVVEAFNVVERLGLVSINRSIWFTPQTKPSVSMSCYTRRAPLHPVADHKAPPDSLPEQPLDLLLFGLHLPMAGKGLNRIRTELLDPFAKHVLVHVQGTGNLCCRHPRSLTSLTASSLNSRLNLRLCMATFGFMKTLKLGVHQTGSSSEEPFLASKRTDAACGRVKGQAQFSDVKHYFALRMGIFGSWA